MHLPCTACLSPIFLQPTSICFVICLLPCCSCIFLKSLNFPMDCSATHHCNLEILVITFKCQSSSVNKYHSLVLYIFLKPQITESGLVVTDLDRYSKIWGQNRMGWIESRQPLPGTAYMSHRPTLLSICCPITHIHSTKISLFPAIAAMECCKLPSPCLQVCLFLEVHANKRSFSGAWYMFSSLFYLFRAWLLPPKQTKKDPVKELAQQEIPLNDFKEHQILIQSVSTKRPILDENSSI